MEKNIFATFLDMYVSYFSTWLSLISLQVVGGD